VHGITIPDSEYGKSPFTWGQSIKNTSKHPSATAKHDGNILANTLAGARQKTLNFV
jgi:hypothetical protein